jgi:hypothetical protein
MRIIVTGMRDWEPRSRVWRALDVATSICALSDVIIVEGGAAGADAHAREWAAMKMVRNISYPADWEKHGKAAGMIRNREMAHDGADVCLAFWDGKSKGTGNMIATAVANGIPVRIWPRWFNTEDEKQWFNKMHQGTLPPPSAAAGTASKPEKN